MIDHPVIDGILTDALWAAGAAGIVLALAAGIWLAVWPTQALRLAEKLNREYSTDWLKRALDERHHSEPFFYRHHRLVGLVLVLATAYFFWSFATAFSVDALVGIYEGLLPKVILEVLAVAATWVLVIGNALGFALGLVMLVRPSAIKGAEAKANRWTDTDRVVGVLDRRVDRPEGYLHRYPRRIGVVIVLATLYIVAITWNTLSGT